MATLSKLKPGDVLYDVHSRRAGNTTTRVQSEWQVRVIEVHDDYALCSWNGNPPDKYSDAELRRFRVTPAKKLNGHVRSCRKSGGWFAAMDCTCPKEEG